MARPRRTPINDAPDPRNAPGIDAPPRRHCCARYDRCLSAAARLDALDIGCGSCTDYYPQLLHHEQALHDARGARRMLLAVYCEPITALDHCRNSVVRQGDPNLISQAS
jgi:hypothetical protein